MAFAELAQIATSVLELSGVIVLVVGIAGVAIVTVARVRRTRNLRESYRQLHQGIGRVILLGLELLVAADIVRTIAVEPTLRSVALLGAIVVIRTFLSFTLEAEIDGQWPWRRKAGEQS